MQCKIFIYDAQLHESFANLAVTFELIKVIHLSSLSKELLMSGYAEMLP